MADDKENRLPRIGKSMARRPSRIGERKQGAVTVDNRQSSAPANEFMQKPIDVDRARREAHLRSMSDESTRIRSPRSPHDPTYHTETSARVQGSTDHVLGVEDPWEKVAETEEEGTEIHVFPEMTNKSVVERISSGFRSLLGPSRQNSG